MIDYFEFYGLPIGFSPDLAVIKQKFYEFSKKYHPDFYINESEEKQEEVLELSTVNNKAYQVLSDPHSRLHYILELKGILREGENYVLPQSFLMDMMDVNETLMDLQSDPDPEKMDLLRTEINGIEKNLSDEIKSLTVTFEGQTPDEQLDILAKVKDLYYRNKYLQRISQRIEKTVS